jgi:Cu(I)/Ag(I) efflux system membrane fusion protein/Cu+-exporting ATPase
MKKLIILASSMLLFLGFSVAQTANTASKPVISYTCSMHPEITSDKPGTCPKCGMDLVLKTRVQYTCPMHPDVISDSPGKCPKCKMDLVVKSSALYSCPMHPEITSMEPGKCLKCGMKLKKAKSQEHQMKKGSCM